MPEPTPKVVPLRPRPQPRPRSAAYVYIDELFRIMAERRVGKRYIEAQGGPTVSTLRKWERGEVQNPQLLTIRGALRILGHDLKIVRSNTR